MNKLKKYFENRKLYSRKKFKSILFHWVFSLTCIILLSQFLTFVNIIYFVVPKETTEMLSDKLYQKAVAIKNISNHGTEITNDFFVLIGDSDIAVEIVGKNTNNNSQFDFSDVITLDMITKAEAGEIIQGVKIIDNIKVPFYLLTINNDLGIIKPNYIYKVEYFATGIRRAIISATLFSIIATAITIFRYLKPIKKVVDATKEVAKGNFEVELYYCKNDEIGILIKNFNNMVKELKKIEYLQNNFVSNVSHEFKTPITSIEGFAKLLQNENLTREQNIEYTDIIVKETQRLSNLSSNLLKINALENVDIGSEKREFSLDEQIRDVILILEKKWEEKNINLNIELETVNIISNEELLYQVWINLIQNAIKFSVYEGEIKISLEEKENSAYITIKDYGIGIKEEDISNIFNRFYKADKARAKEGSGLGLTIVKRIIEILNGNIYCKSEFGEYTEFTIILPLNLK